MSILDGMTLDEAKDCIGKQIRKNGEISVLIVGKRVFICPDQAGLKARCGMTFSEQLETGGHKTCEECWTAALTAHYAQPETRWMEPQLDSLHFYDRARTNAERYLREFARLNGGEGDYYIRFDKKAGKHTVAYDADGHGEGTITFSIFDAAKHIIDHKPELLKAIQGVRT